MDMNDNFLVDNLELCIDRNDIKRKYGWLIFMVILVILITKIPNFFSFVNKDVGAFAYIGEQILEGKMLYKDFWSSKPPGVYYLNAFVFYILPNTFLSLRIFELIYCLFTSFALYKLSRLFYTKKTSLIVTLIYSFFSNIVAINEEGMMTETYMLLPMILTIYLFILFKNKQKKIYLIWVGLMAGMAFMFKQPGLSCLSGIFLFLILESFFRKASFKELFTHYLLISIGLGIIFSIIITYFILKKGWSDLIFDVFIYNYWRSKAYNFGISTVAKGLLNFLYIGIPLCYLSIMSVSLYFVFFWYNFIQGKEKGRNEITNLYPKNNLYFLLLICWAIFDLFSVCIGGAFYQHYRLQVIPSLSLISGYMIERAFVYQKVINKGKIFTILLVCSFTFPVSSQLNYSLNILVRRIILNKKNTQERIAKWLIKNSKGDDYIYVWGDECSINFLSKRKIPSRYIHLYPLYTTNYTREAMIKEFIDDLKQNRPKYIVDTSVADRIVPSFWRNELPRNSKELPKELRRLYEKEWLIPIINFIRNNYILKQAIDNYCIFVFNSQKS